MGGDGNGGEEGEGRRGGKGTGGDGRGGDGRGVLWSPKKSLKSTLSHNFTGSQHSLIIFGTGIPYTILY